MNTDHCSMLLHLCTRIDLVWKMWFDFECVLFLVQFNVLSQMHTEKLMHVVVVVQFGKWKMSTIETTISDNESRCFIRAVSKSMMYKLFVSSHSVFYFFLFFVMLKVLFRLLMQYFLDVRFRFGALSVPASTVTFEVVKVYEPWQ